MNLPFGYGFVGWRLVRTESRWWSVPPVCGWWLVAASERTQEPSSLPVEQVLTLGPRLVQDGAQAISIATPRGALMMSPRRHGDADHLITGRLYGPSLFAHSLETVFSAVRIGLPIIGSGGVWSKENAEAMLSVGALAVQVDAALWGFSWLNQSSIE